MRCIIGAVVFVFVFQEGLTLQCWKCSSDIDPSCRDPFNDYSSSSSRGRSSSSYDNLQQNYNQRQVDNQRQYDYNRQYDPNYNNRQYDQNNYNRQYDQNPTYNSGYRNNYNSKANLEVCDENEARNRRMKNVCLKEIVRGSNYVSVVRRCELVPFEQTVGTCSQGVSRGLLLDFCEYCDFDGCNSATGLKTNIFLAVAISSIVLFLYH